MADDSLEVQKDEVPFHPCHTPRGMTWFNLDDLTSVQQKLLSGLKVDIAKDNNKYLARHPEIRAIISILLQAILKEQPKLKTVGDFAKDFFSNMTRDQLQDKIDHYLEKRGEPCEKATGSALITFDHPDTRSSEEDLASMYRKDYYTWMTFTTESTLVDEEFTSEWTSTYETPKTYQVSEATTEETPTDITTTQTDTTTKQQPQNEIDLLFASMATFCSGEHSFEKSETDITDEFAHGDESSHSEPSKDSESFDEDLLQDALVEEEIKLAEEIQGKLSVIIERIDEEEENEEDYSESIIDKRSIIEMDLESLRGRQSSLEGEEYYEEDYRHQATILETLLNYEMSIGG